MPRVLRAYLIDPAARTITPLDYSGGDDPRAICALVSADCLDSAKVGAWDGVACVAFVDDEGLIKPNACFRFDGYGNPLAGKALLLGCDRNGFTVECPLALEEVQSRVRWIPQAHALAKIRADQALSAADHRARGFKVETEQNGLVNIITPPGRT